MEKTDERGAALIVEYIIVLPVVFAVIFFLIFMGQAFYQEAVISSAADRMLIYVNKVAADYMYKDVVPFSFNGAGDYNGNFVSERLLNDVERKPYRYITGLFVQNIDEGTLSNLERQLEEYIAEKDLFFGRNASAEIKIEGQLFKRVSVTVTQKFKSPFNLSILGITDYEYKFYCESNVVQATEIIRTTQFVAEILKPYIDKGKDTINGVINNFKNALSSVTKLDSFKGN